MDWKWNPDVNQDGFWLGAVNGGFKLQLYGDNWRTPLINCYYHLRPLMVPESWGGADGHSGGIRLAKSFGGNVQAVAYSGRRELTAGKVLDFKFKLFLTPFKPLNTDAQWSQRYYHPGLAMGDRTYYQLEKVRAMGANLLNTVSYTHLTLPTNREV